MKLAYLLAALLSSGAAGAQHLPARQVPAPAATAFARTFPAATNVRWQQENATYTASYELPQAPGTAVFDATGALLETRTIISDHRLPALARTYMAEQFPHREVDQILRLVDAAGTVTYAAQVCRGKAHDCQTTYFDQDGRPLRKEP
ncbi:hypothetical protein HHL22_02890 [Hymenobacter sp. RP-2-7]|uniref:Beta-lactamase-inhibitor-like PepSY-like domain-containing protein n=1 Tax=Hymenobacter polaris TaxID=2682546 RepID=A0A7Y0ABH8_9BACT|nr:hypothetical protein [Hymenobacter polaris]NML64142.1 hypothetical protein [Hymenobacter polaris]